MEQQTYDVIVIGFGGAGACAAIEAADAEASVLVLERFDGGGATSRSGGVVYAGGGTTTQREAGFDDDPRQMLRYLQAETGGAVDPGLLRRFCDQSPGDMQWLERLGLRFPPRFYPGKATEPPPGHGLYYSGNEVQRGAVARSAPRGHLPAARARSGPVLFEALRQAAGRRGVELRCHSRVAALTTERGRVTGVEVQQLEGALALRSHRLLFGAGLASRAVGPSIAALEQRVGRRYRVRARRGVVICAGGFVFNAQMMQRHAPAHAGCMPLGTPGDDGGGIRLGQSVGGATALMEQCAAWRFIYPPEAFVHGLLINSQGRRVCDESLYGATLGRHVAAQPDGEAYLVIDGQIADQVRGELAADERLRDHPLKELLDGELNALVFRKLSARINLHLNRHRAATLEALARRCGIPADALVQTVAEHNQRCADGLPDATGKPDPYRAMLVRPPYRAIRCNLDNRLFLGPCITLGGLQVDAEQGRVLREDGAPIGGLFAAGRSAVGICSGGYVSGLSIADCIFSGRRAGRAVMSQA